MKGKTLTGDPPASTALQRGCGWGPRTSHLPLVSLEDEHESQRQAQRGQGHEQHACPVVPQGKHLAGGVDVGPHHHIENLREVGQEQGQEHQSSREAAPLKGTHFCHLLGCRELTGPVRD